MWPIYLKLRMSQSAALIELAKIRAMTYMSIQKKIAGHIQNGDLFKLTSLDFELWGLAENETARTMYVSSDIMAVVTPPFADTLEGERLGKFRAWLDGFIEGAYGSVAEDPDEKPPAAMLARVHPVDAELWSIRVTEPENTPGLRSFGAFAAKDDFVALSWNMRENISDFDNEVAEIAELWRQYFQPETPHRGDSLDEYLTVYSAV